MGAALAALAACLAVWAAWPCPDHRLLRRLADLPDAAPRTRSLGRRLWVALGLAALVVVAGAVDPGRGAAVVGASGLLAWTFWVLAGRARRRRRISAERAGVTAAAEGLAGLLRVGSIPAAALSALAAEHPVLAETSAEHAIGGDVVGALRREAVRPGREGLASLAAAWEVASRTGASMQSAIEVISDDLHSRQERASTVRVELAASRLAGRLLAALPLAGIGLGYAFGGDPIAFLTRNTVGQACLVVAAGLTGVGLLWTDWLAERGEG